MAITERERLTRVLVQEIIDSLESCQKQADPGSPEYALAHKLLENFHHEGLTLAEVSKHLRDGTSPSGMESYFRDMLLTFLTKTSEVGRSTWEKDPDVSSEESYTGIPPNTPPRPR